MRPPLPGGTLGNRRLTASTGVLLNSLLWIQLGSALFFAFETFNFVLPAGPWHSVIRPVHFFVGFLLVPLILIKLASTGYKLARYYLRNPSYKEMGPPRFVARAIAPLLVISVLVVFVSGLEMWSFRNDFGVAWIPIHVISSIVFVVALVVHIALHVREAHDEAAADMVSARPAGEGGDEVEWRRGTLTRRAIIGGGFSAGLLLAMATAQWPLQRLAVLSPRRTGDAPLDFPVMNYEGGAQVVDLSRWRLVVDGERDLVRSPLSLTYEDILKLPTEEHEFAIDCVTGWTAVRRWRGIPLARLLEAAGASDDFGHVLVRSTSGYHWSHHRSNVLLTGSLLVTHVNGVPLNDDHGFPARILIPGTIGQSNIKWVDRITVRRGAPEVYVAPNLKYDPSLPTSGKLLPKNPAGRRP